MRESDAGEWAFSLYFPNFSSLTGGNMETVKKLPVHRRRSDPPKRLSRKAKAVWRRTWKEAPSGHFSPEHFTLLGTFCETVALFERVSEEVSNMDTLLDIEGKLDPRARLAADLPAKIASLSTKLRLNVSSHTPDVHGKKKPAAAGNWWESRRESG
jgi:phage terminase small subunit